jgi:hypothetical protein
MQNLQVNRHDCPAPAFPPLLQDYWFKELIDGLIVETPKS